MAFLFRPLLCGIDFMTDHLWTRVACNSHAPKKIIRDPIHGSIELDLALLKIIDTPQFQRLRRIKQLGGASFVYPGAVHTRFEHSIGVCHIAGELLKELKQKPGSELITEEDVLCVKIAALCHDLGHGPFSHLYDMLVEKVDATQDQKKQKKHEYRSAKIVELVLNELWDEKEFEQLRQEKDSHLKFIQKLITFDKDLKRNPTLIEKWDKEEMGREEEKAFLFEIVANGHTGIDVDKMDYFARDSHGLGLPNRFDWRRFVQVAQVIKVPQLNYRRRLCTREKEAQNLYELFNTRSVLHRIAYQHKTVRIVERLICDALKHANDHVHINGFPIMRCWEDMDAFQLLDDTIVDAILDIEPAMQTKAAIKAKSYIRISEGEGLTKARDLLKRVTDRQLPKFVGKRPAADRMKPKDLVDVACPGVGKAEYVLEEPVTFSYGKSKKNPMEEHYFFTREWPKHPFTLPKKEVSKMLPDKFREEVVFLYYDTYEHGKKDQAHAKKAKQYLWEYLNAVRLPEPFRKNLQSLYQMRKALKDADQEEAAKLEDAIRKKKEEIEEQRKELGMSD